MIYKDITNNLKIFNFNKIIIYNKIFNLLITNYCLKKFSVSI